MDRHSFEDLSAEPPKGTARPSKTSSTCGSLSST